MTPPLPTHGLGVESTGRAMRSALITLTLGMLGSSVLPLPYAISRTGVLLGVLTAVAVSYANALTGTLLVKVAAACEAKSYESLADKLGGQSWRRFTQCWLVLLLFGTLCGDFALIADTGKLAVGRTMGDAAPAWLVNDDGRLAMTVLALGLVLPLSCMRHIRKLEQAALVGVGLVALLIVVVARNAFDAGFPAIKSGELPLAKLRLSADLPEAVGVLSFAFYVHPMLLPLLAEMPHGAAGAAMTARATQIITCGVGVAVYLAVGVFGAATYGVKTQGDILLNGLLPGKWDGAFDAGMAVYLSLSVVPIALTLRLQLDALILGHGVRPSRRHINTVVSLVVLSALGVALCFPTYAEKMFAVTGASAVCVVCYALPILFHLRLFFRSTDISAASTPATSPFAALAETADETRQPLLSRPHRGAPSLALADRVSSGSPPAASDGTAAAAGAGERVDSLAVWHAGPDSPAGSSDDTGAVARRVGAGQLTPSVSLAHWVTRSGEQVLVKSPRDTESGEVDASIPTYPSWDEVLARPSRMARASGILGQLIAPVVILVLGTATSCLGFYLAVVNLLH